MMCIRTYVRMYVHTYVCITLRNVASMMWISTPSYNYRVCQSLWSSSMSQSTTLSLSLLAAVETCADKLESRRFDIGMRDFVGDAAFLQENRPSLPLKRKRASADLTTPSSS